MRKTKKINYFLTIGFVLLLLYTISFLLPFLWSMITSFKDEIDFMTNKFGLPTQFRFNNYGIALRNMAVPIMDGNVQRNVYFAELFINSISYAFLSTITHTLTPLITAYAVARFDFKLGKVIYAIVIVTMILPIIGNLASEIQVAKALGFFDNLFGLAIMKGHFLGINFLIFYASFISIPKDYSEAAQIDGASQWEIFTKIFIPLVKSSIGAVALLSFIIYWNDYTTPMIYLPSRPTISYALYRLNTSTTNESSFVTIRMAGSMIVSLPILVVFLFSKNKLMTNVNVGGIKG